MRPQARVLALELRRDVRDGVHGEVHGGVEPRQLDVHCAVKGRVGQRDDVGSCRWGAALGALIRVLWVVARRCLLVRRFWGKGVGVYF